MTAIVYEDGVKLYGEYETTAEAEDALKEAIEYMDGDNWCGLHIADGYGEDLPETTMFEEFLNENYGISQEEFNKLDVYNKRVVEREWDAWMDSLEG